ncbi:MAG: hypothetical protein PHU63_04420 [Candidatus ainarchaeum sp.]|nr:hypothetical protein [Candidatus ainarchaeum sp.]
MGKREKFLKKTREQMIEALRSRDIFLAKLNSSIEELDGVINLLGERLEDMFKLYTPNLELKDREKYASMVSYFEGKFDHKELSKLLGSAKANEVIASIDIKDAKEGDWDKCREFAYEIVRLYELRKEMEKYQEIVCKDECPNLTHVGGASIAAKLIAHVGSLKRLALMPASTIQVIGAERALFKHLKNRKVRPPKHGILFQHPIISNSPKKVRGKIARTLAAKLASAAKADAFTKNFIAEKLKNEFDERCRLVMEEYKKGKKDKN